MQHCAYSLTWRWRRHCAPGGAALRGCRLWPLPAGSGAAQQTQLQDSRRSQAQAPASLRSYLSVSACHMPALGLQLTHPPSLSMPSMRALLPERHGLLSLLYANC